MVFTAFTRGDICDKRVADLGCGTGILALGSALMGASMVTGLDIDGDSVKVAMDITNRWGYSDTMDLRVMDVKDFHEKVDTVIMNPPFGAQKRSADIPFLETALRIAPKIYSLHNARAERFIQDLILRSGYSIVEEKRYMFGVDNLFEFHRHKVKEIEVVMFVSSS